VDLVPFRLCETQVEAAESGFFGRLRVLFHG
jgi:hypothetical protein